MNFQNIFHKTYFLNVDSILVMFPFLILEICVFSFFHNFDPTFAFVDFFFWMQVVPTSLFIALIFIISFHLICLVTIPISILISCVFHGFFRIMLLYFQLFGDFLGAFLLILKFIPLCKDIKLFMIFLNFYLFFLEKERVCKQGRAEGERFPSREWSWVWRPSQGSIS